mgnify:CR=1 FL=1
MIYTVVADKDNATKLFVFPKQSQLDILRKSIDQANKTLELFHGLDTPVYIIDIYYDDFYTYGTENVVFLKDI